MTALWWGEPAAGDIVWCRFPDDIHPCPKPRPALILTVFDDDAPHFTVRVAYGTRQKITTLHRGEFSILRDRHPAAHLAAGLTVPGAARMNSMAPCVDLDTRPVAFRVRNLATHKSLGVIRPDRGSIKFRHRPMDAGSEDDRQLQAAFKQVSLLDGGPLSRLPVEYDFSYRFTCAGHKHDMKIHDWEIQAAYLSYKQRYGAGALPELRRVYEEDIPTRNLHLVMGTMKAHPRQFIVIGLLRSCIDPVDATRQASLL